MTRLPTTSPPERSDVDLVQAWTDGDRAAAQVLIERHIDAILRFFRTKAAAQAEDLTQQTFLRCAESRSRYSRTSTFRAFLFGIARNVLFEHYRQKGRNRDPDFTVTSVVDLSPGASTAMFERDQERLLVQALQHLPLELQALLELYYWEELRVGELAAVFEVPTGTIKSRLHRARSLLRDALEDVPGPQEAKQSAELMLAEWVAGVQGRRDTDEPPEDSP